MKEINLTQGKVALVDDEDYDWLNQYKWCALKYKHGYYAVRSMWINGKNTRIIMPRLILDIKDSKVLVDHKDRNGLNNQRYNIRKATKAQNRMNCNPKINGSSIFLGVKKKRNIRKGLQKRKLPPKYWIASIKTNNKTKTLGTFETEIEAARAYNNAAKMYHGEFANLNNV